MIEVARAILSDRHETMGFNDLLNEVQAFTGKSDEEIRTRLSQFYTDLNIDGSFISLGDTMWGLRSWYPIDSIDEAVHLDLEEEVEGKPKKKKKRKKINAFLADADDDDDVIDYNDDDPEDDDFDVADTDDDDSTDDDDDDDKKDTDDNIRHPGFHRAHAFFLGSADLAGCHPGLVAQFFHPVKGPFFFWH